MAERPVKPWIERLWRVFGDGGGTAYGAYDPWRRALRTFGYTESQFGELIVTERTPIIELNSAYGLTRLRNVWTTANGATTDDITGTLDTGEISLSTGTNSAGKATVRAAEVARYIPGFSAEAGLGVRFEGAPVANQVARWGIRDIDEENGLYFEYSSSGIDFVRLRGGTVQNRVAQADWNIDRLDGNGPSGYTLDITRGVIFQIDYTWYGYGQILVGIVGVINNIQTFIPCHTIDNRDFTGTSIKRPNLYLFHEAENTGATTNLTAYIGGRQYSVVGRYRPKFRFVSDRRIARANIGTTWVPLVSFRRKTAFRNRSIKISGFDGNAVNQNLIYEIRLGASLTGASFGTPTNHTASETALESDKAATAGSGGIVLWDSLALSGVGNSSPLAGVDFRLDIPEEEVVTLGAYATAGTNGQSTSVFRMKEEW